jgi:hypothetical protein
MTAAPATGFVRIKSSDPPVTLTARLADTRPNVDAGYGGWAEVARPRRRPLSVWTGSPGLRLTLPVLFDSFRSGLSVERQLSQLEKLSLPTAADGAPPRLRIQARGGHVPHTDRVWVVDSLTWGDATMNKSGNRTRQQVTLALLEYIADVRVNERSTTTQTRRQAAAAKSKSGAARKRVVAAKGKAKTAHRARAVASSSSFGDGEDLLSIAARELGDADRWIEIAQLNGLRDPRAIVTGQTLRMP